MVSKKKIPEENSLLENFEFHMQYPNSIPLTLSPEDTKRLLQELKIKEAELELKNEQLQSNIRNLQKSKQQFIDYLSKMSIAYFDVESNGIIYNVNHFAAELLEISPASLLNQSIYQYISQTYKSSFETALSAAKNSGNGNHFIVKLVKGNGKQILVNVEINCIDLENRFELLLDTGNSITANDKLFKSLADNAPDVIMRLDSDFRYTFINSQIEKITGIPAEEYLGRTNEEMGMPVELCHYWNLMFIEAAISGSLQESEMEFPGSDKSSFFNIRVVVEKNESGSVQSYLGIWHNITKRKEWEETLQESEENLKHAESLVHIGNYQLNLKTGKCKWSDEFYRILGFKAQEFPASKEKLWQVIHPEDRLKAQKVFNKALRNKSGFQFESRLLRSKHDFKYIISMGEIITDSNHEPIELKGVIQDVTSSKKVEISLKESQENYRLLFESLPVGLAISDNKGKILYGNRKSRLLLGITHSELKQGAIDLNHWKFIRKDGGPVTINELPNISANIENRIVGNNEIGIIRDNEKITWLNVTAALLPGKSDILIAFIDISDKIEREKQLQELSEKLSELNATKDKFFSIIAHDLKNPFNSILGFSELLMKNLKKYNAEEIERFTGIINSTSQSAYNLLENLLNWSRSQTGTIDFCPRLLDLGEVLIGNLEFVDHLALKKNITIYFESEGEYWVEIDKNMIDTVLRNLLTNAIKFSYPGGKVIVELRRKGNDFHVSIKDNGIGIEEENMDKLFRIDRKYSTSGTNQERGSGLGLIICKEFIERNNGKIWAFSEFGKGSEFFFSLPKSTNKN